MQVARLTRLIPTLAAVLMLIAAGREALRWGNGTIIEKSGDWYLGYGDNLWAGRGWQECIPSRNPASWRCETLTGWTAYRLPVYPAYLAALMPIAGDYTPFVARGGQAVMIALTVYLAVSLAGHVAGPLAAVLTAIACLGYWTQFPHDGMMLLTEPLYGLLVTSAVYGMVLHPRRVAWWGGLWGIAALTRGNLLLITPLLIALSYRPLRFTAAFALPIGLWALRNALVLGAFVPFSTGSGQVLNGVYNNVTWGFSWDNAPNVQLVQDVAGDELAQDQEGRRRALAWLDQHSDPAWYFLQKAVYTLYNPFTDNLSMQRGARALTVLFAGGAVAWAGYYLIRFIRLSQRFFGGRARGSAIPCLLQPAQVRMIRLVVVMALGLSLNSIIFYSTYRFRQPLEPVLFAGGFVWLLTALPNIRHLHLSGPRLKPNSPDRKQP